jgi:cell division protein FtsI/penicillin-binding protein 2
MSRVSSLAILLLGLLGVVMAPASPSFAKSTAGAAARAAETSGRGTLQAAAEELLEEYHAAYGAIVAVRVPDAKVLALAGRSRVEPALGSDDLALRPWAPAASVFKLVTAAALLDGRKLAPETRVCFHGGMHALEQIHLLDVPRLDHNCETLGFAVGHSQNAVIAKLAHRFLDPEVLRRYAGELGFGEEIPFDRAVVPSIARVPAEPLAFARTAAGFTNVNLSPLHAALLANAIASEGWYRTPLAAGHRAMSPAAARLLGAMMIGTTQAGTARGAFHDSSGHALLPFSVAGKTGTLSRPDPYLAYSWFVGFAPADHPQIAFAVLLGNRTPSAVKAALVARRLLERHLPDATLAAR